MAYLYDGARGNILLSTATFLFSMDKHILINRRKGEQLIKIYTLVRTFRIISDHLPYLKLFHVWNFFLSLLSHQPGGTFFFLIFWQRVFSRLFDALTSKKGFTWMQL